jgi:predicted transcriptional regulator
MTITPWASQPLDAGINQALSAMEAGMHVALIATFDLKTCKVSDVVEEVLTHPELKAFDFIPVRDENDIVGVLYRPYQGEKQVIGLVGEAMQSIHESMLICANDSLLSFIEYAEKTPYRLVTNGQGIVGIVTHSDLQKFAVRPVLFSLITAVELLLAEWVRQKYPDEKEWLATLSEGRSKLIEQRWLEWSPGNMAMDKLSVSEFCDKRELALNLGAFSNKSAARKKLKYVEWLRHAVMHSGDYALTRENAQLVACTVRFARELIQILQDSLVIAK